MVVMFLSTQVSQILFKMNVFGHEFLLTLQSYVFYVAEGKCFELNTGLALGQNVALSQGC